MARREQSPKVYSSEHGRICPNCGLPSKRCQCRANPRGKKAVTNPDGDGTVRVGRTSKGRGGKTVTQISGLQLGPSEFGDLARDLKRRCGSGGSIRGDVIEIQGDQCDALIRELEARGFKVKRTGG